MVYETIPSFELLLLVCKKTPKAQKVYVSNVAHRPNSFCLSSSLHHLSNLYNRIISLLNLTGINVLNHYTNAIFPGSEPDELVQRSQDP